MSQKLGIQFLRDLAKTKNGKCLSNTYMDRKTEYLWKCSNNHEFNMKIHSIQKGAWCPTCKHNKYYEDLVAAAKAKNGFLLTKEYLGATKKHRWKCAQGHEWEAKATKIKNDGSWCPECPKVGIEKMRRIAEERGAKCISTIYVNNTTKLDWICEKNHRFKASASSVLQGSWCPECRKIDIKDLRKKASDKGGELLSTEYENQFVKLKWRCSYNHKFNMSAHDVMSKKGHWCPKCKESYGEKFTRLYFEKYFDKKFEKIRPKWLLGENNSPLELDGYNEELKIAFEHQGHQHYDLNHSFNKMSKNERQIFKNDQIKQKTCEKQRITLVYIPQLKPEDGIESNKKIINKILKESGYTKNKAIHIQEKELYTSKNFEKYNKIKDIVEEKGGKLITQAYISSESELDVICGNKHNFKTSGGSITSGRWCPECAPNKKLSYNEVKKNLREKKILCLSKEYINSTSPLKLKCLDCKNIWESDYNNINSGRGCPVCGRKISNDSKRIPIKDVIDTAKKLGFSLVDKNSYTDAHGKSEWKCKKRHTFHRSFVKLKTNPVCPICKKEKK